MAQVEVHSLSKHFANGVRALDNVSLSFEAGIVTTVLGSSGAGKSTLLRCINGLETPTSGSVHVGGLEVLPRSMRAVRREVGMIFQQFNLVPRLSVLSNVLTGTLGRRGILTNLFFMFPGADVDDANRAIQRVGLNGREQDRVQKLSGGQQQRVAIARTIVHNPNVLLADEPVASLDPTSSVEILELLVALAEEMGTTLILNLHQVELAVQFSQRIVGLKRGRVLFDVKATDLSNSNLDELYGRSAVA